MSKGDVAAAAFFARAWVRPEETLAVAALGHGLINQTWRVTTSGGYVFVLQRLSRTIFPRPEHIQSNIRQLHDAAIESDGVLQLPRPLACQHDADTDHVLEGDAAVWRALSYIQGGHSLHSLASSCQAVRAGELLGRFHERVSGLAPERFLDTLPGFHVAPAYYAELMMAAAAAPGLASLSEVGRMLDFVRQRRALIGVLESARLAGLLTERIIHGDPKLDNMLFHEETREPLAMVDLDTVKPGLVHYDIADCLRSACNRRGELSDTVAVGFDLDIAMAILEGYLRVAGRWLTPMDRILLVPAVVLLPLELGMRFLSDHLRGDVYFRVDAPGQNLARAAVQFALVSSIESMLPELRRGIGRLLQTLAPIRSVAGASLGFPVIP